MSEPITITKPVYDKIAFARLAKEHFDAHSGVKTFSRTSPPTLGELFAVRWAGKDETVSVLVFELPCDTLIIGDLDL
jgi:hypothetical protein